jgi:hypothetical protein
MKIKELVYRERIKEFESILEIYHSNPIVNYAIKSYALGLIKTKEECWVAMVKVMHEHNALIVKEYTKVLNRTPVFVQL